MLNAVVVALLLPALIATLPANAASTAAGKCVAVSLRAPKLPQAQFEDGPMVLPAGLVADFDAWIAGIKALNPDLSIRVDMPSLDREAARIRASLTKATSRREAWMHFGLLNPYLHDGHDGLYMPDYRDALEAHIKAGGHIVPIEVRVAADKSLRVFSVAPGTDDVKPGDRVLSINGHSADKMMKAMVALSPGDTPAFQQAWAVRRFAMLYWYLYGDTGQYDVAVRSEQSAKNMGCTVRVRLAGAATLPEALQSQPKAQDLFAWRILPDDIGYLRVDSLDPNLANQLASVAHTAFAQFKQDGIKALIVDVRENGGGDDPLWQQSLMEYITDKPYAQLSHYEMRITKKNADPGDVVGTVQRADYTKRFMPKPVEPLRFGGPIYILAGPYSYSATIQFIVAAQDFGIARIAGEETAALSCQTGKYETIDLPKTGLYAAAPAINYTRPSGQGCMRGVIPDVPIAIDEVMPDKTLNALVAKISAGQ